MNLVNILVGLYLFTLNTCVFGVMNGTTFALNTYVCSVMDGGFLTAQSILIGQNETSYSVRVEFVDNNIQYQTVLSHVEFEEVEEDLCTCAYVVNNVRNTREKYSTKDFSRLMSIGLNTELQFYIVDKIDDVLRIELIKRLREASKMINKSETEYKKTVAMVEYEKQKVEKEEIKEVAEDNDDADSDEDEDEDIIEL